MAASSQPPATADPRPPALPHRLAGSLDVADLDELYADLDGLDLDGATITLPEARTVDVLRSRLRDCVLEIPHDCPIETRDAVLHGLDLTGRRIKGLVRTQLVRCRLGGADLSEATLEDVAFDDCALDLASWRMARVRRVAVVGGRIEGLDASGAELSDLRIADVPLTSVTLDGSRCARVDLTAADLAGVDAISTLAGTTISTVQAVALATRFARGLGIVVAPPPGDP